MISIMSVLIQLAQILANFIETTLTTPYIEYSITIPSRVPLLSSQNIQVGSLPFSIYIRPYFRVTSKQLKLSRIHNLNANRIMCSATGVNKKSITTHRLTVVNGDWQSCVWPVKQVIVHCVTHCILNMN